MTNYTQGSWKKTLIDIKYSLFEMGFHFYYSLDEYSAVIKLLSFRNK